MKFNCIIVDDEPLAIELLKSNIERIPYLECVGTFNQVSKAINFMKSNVIDLAFLDIQMPGKTGIDIAQSYPNLPVIFTTAYDEYAIKAFEVAAIDYILKPIEFKRFEKACTKAKEYLHSLTKHNTKEFIFIRSEYQVVKLKLDEIIYIEGLKDYVKIFMKDEKKPVLTRSNLKGIFNELNDIRFLRVHKSYIANCDHIKSLASDSLTFSNSFQIPVGEVYRSCLQSLFK